jgi:superfamily II DNA or RNA helicase
MKLEDFQRDACARVKWAWAAGAHRVVMQIPTGGGKTFTAAHLMSQGGRWVFAAHLDSLVSDTHARLVGAGIHAGIVAPWTQPDPSARVQVCSIGTLTARGLVPETDKVVVDECHRANAAELSAWLRRYPLEVKVLGLTATPQRGDGQAMSDIWDELVLGPSVQSLISRGMLVQPTLFCAPQGTVGDGVRELLRRRAEWKRALYFCDTKEQARAVFEKMRGAGFLVGEMYGETRKSERDALRQMLRQGKLDVLVGCDVFVEGFDEPAVDCIVLDAPFGTVGRYLQACGRGTRRSPGKTEVLILDIRGAVYFHGLPDEDRRWTLGGTTDGLREPGIRIATCGKCGATFRCAAKCPRCGAIMAPEMSHAPPPLTKAEKLEKYEKVPLESRKKAYFNAMFSIFSGRFRMSDERAKAKANEATEKKFHGQM